jgi:hypothetical protein
VASLAERPTGAAPQSSTAPMLSTDRLTESGSEAPPAASSTASPWPNEDYRGWASL